MNVSGRRAFNPSVHGARGLFSAMVFVFHITNSGLPTFAYPGSSWVKFYLLSFKFGVELFFGISGIVILGALSRASSLPIFAWDRFTRIYPVLWATLTVVLVLGTLVHAPLPSLSTVLLNFIIPPPGLVLELLNPAAWSLSFELAFYVLCALAWPWRARPGVVPVTVVVGLTLIAFFPRTMLMLPGVLIGVGQLRWRPVVWLSRFPLFAMSLFLLLWNGVEAYHGSQTGSISPAIMPLVRWVLYLPVILAAGVLGSAALLGVAEARGVAGRILKTRAAQWMGTISYSFYLWHPIVLTSVKRLLIACGVLQKLGHATQLVIFLIGLPVALGVAFGSQVLIEKRFTRWLRQLFERPAEVHSPITTVPPETTSAAKSIPSALATASKGKGR